MATLPFAADTPHRYNHAMTTDTDMPDPVLTGFAPVVRPDTRLLVMGSFPGRASLDAAQYYAHPRNQFWRLLSAVLGQDLVTLDYASRLNALLTRQIGLWDVIARCQRQGSLDSAIRAAEANQVETLFRQAPQLHTICFNGKTAGKAAPMFAEAGFTTLVLPSSSPANAQLSFEDKLQHWQLITKSFPV